MSSHTRKLTETIRTIEALKKSLLSTASDSEYQRGLYNGVEMFRALLQNQDAKIMDKEKKEKTQWRNKMNTKLVIKVGDLVKTNGKFEYVPITDLKVIETNTHVFINNESTYLLESTDGKRAYYGKSWVEKQREG